MAIELSLPPFPPPTTTTTTTTTTTHLVHEQARCKVAEAVASWMNRSQTVPAYFSKAFGTPIKTAEPSAPRRRAFLAALDVAVSDSEKVSQRAAELADSLCQIVAESEKKILLRGDALASLRVLLKIAAFVPAVG